MKASPALFILLLLVLNAYKLFAQTPVVLLQNNLQQSSLTNELLYLRDAEGVYTIDQISSLAFADSFQVASQDYLNFGFLNEVYWFCVEVKGTQMASNQYFFELAYPPLDSIFFFQKNKAGEWEHQLTGDLLPFSQRNGYFYNYIFPLDSSSLQSHRYYFRVRTQGALTFPLHLKEAFTLNQDISFGYFKYGLYYGALLLILLYNLFIYLSLRLKSYLFYCVYILFSIISQSFLYGHGQQFLWPYGGTISNLISGASLLLAMGFALLFTIHFVRTGKYVPRLHLVLSVFCAVVFLLALSTVIAPYQFAVSLIPSIYIVSVLLIILSAATAWYHGQKTARLFLLAWIVYLISLFSYSLQSMGLLGNVESATTLVMFGSTTEALLLSLALADRIRQYRKDRQRANEDMLMALQDKQEILEQQQSVLEQRVSERTTKLEHKQKEVIKQNRQLFEQQKLIEQQYQQLSVLNENLEKIVGTRTGELRKANISLHKRNQQLEQFAYIISHNLRGPVASIIGLIKLFDRNQMGGADNIQYMDMLNQSVGKLDMVISDLGQVLTLEQNVEKHYREIDVRESVEGILQKLQMQVKAAELTVETDFRAFRVDTHPAYLESVLYNLISNAIKYKDHERSLVISIKTWLDAGQFYISIADTGLGIDLEQYGKRLFSLYQRFHTHTEGKGLGLYMVKRQVESLGGKIEVESKPGEGSTFTVCLPLHRE